MVAILDFKMAAIQKLYFAYNSRTKHDRKENSTGIARFIVIESNETIFKIPRWPPSWIFKMAAIQKLILLITPKLNMIERQTQRLHLGF